MKQMRFVSVLLLSLANPLWAKCPNNFVEVHGKVQCTFKPDYNLLVMLIYSKHQREASGQETALDMRLIAADGTEWDRKELKIADAFRYDEERGQYTVRSDLILQGWCEPKKCAEAPSTPCGKN